MEQNKYIKFKYEDFLQDPYFLESMKTPVSYTHLVGIYGKPRLDTLFPG